MGTSKTAPKPRPGKLKRRTSFSIDQEVWDRLKEIERKTYAKPSTVANQVLSDWLKIVPCNSTPAGRPGDSG